MNFVFLIWIGIPSTLKAPGVVDPYEEEPKEDPNNNKDPVPKEEPDPTPTPDPSPPPAPTPAEPEKKAEEFGSALQF